jgi:GntR family transcriptional regulator
MEREMRAGALPRYIEVSEMLIRQIAAGQLADGARLAPEREMASGLGISVGTLRKSLADLQAKGLLRRVQGSGNYVRRRPGVASVYALFHLERPGGGGLPTADTLSVDRLAKPADAPPFGPGPEGHRIRRLRRLDGAVVALEEIWLDGDRAARIAPGDLSESLYRFYRTRLGLVIAQVEDRVRTGPVPDWAPAGFPLPPGRIAGYVERLSQAASVGPVEFSRTWFDGDRAQYVSRSGRG